MGKYKRIGEIAVMEVGHAGVRKRARAIAIAAEASSGNKRRKAAPRELRCSPSIFQLRSGGRVEVKPKDSVSPSTSRIVVQRTVSNDRCSGHSSDNFPTSCCSSTASSDRAKEGFNVSDLEVRQKLRNSESSSRCNSLSLALSHVFVCLAMNFRN